MKRLFLLTLALGSTLPSTTLAQAPETRWTLTPLVGAKYVTETRRVPESSARARFAPLPDERGVVLDAGFSGRFQASPTFSVDFLVEGFRGNAGLHGPFQALHPSEIIREDIANQKSRWQGWSTELRLRRAFALGSSWQIAPRLSGTFTQWNQRRELPTNPLIPVGQVDRRWLRGGLGLELAHVSQGGQRLFVAASLVNTFRFRVRDYNYQTQDDFRALIAYYATTKVNFPVPMTPTQAAERVRVIYIDRDHTFRYKLPLSYALEAGWESDRLKISALLESFQHKWDLSGWRDLTSFTTLRLGIPIRFKQQKAQPGYFLPGRAR